MQLEKYTGKQWLRIGRQRVDRRRWDSGCRGWRKTETRGCRAAGNGAVRVYGGTHGQRHLVALGDQRHTKVAAAQPGWLTAASKLSGYRKKPELRKPNMNL